MSALGTYSFLPWLRIGLANEIRAADGDSGVRVRARIDVGLDLKGDRLAGGTAVETVTRSVALYGPGDIVGIDRRAIVRVEPQPLTTNFEPNYLPAIEFYDEDFPWRYTPAAPDPTKRRLRPWLTLVVLEPEAEFTDPPARARPPLPSILLRSLDVLPKAEELWAWAHVHVNRSLAGSDAEFVSKDMGAVIPRLEALIRQNPDLAYSRIVCPRKLKADTAYHAFLIPTFETGRRAGLALEIGDLPATTSAWAPGQPDGLRLPFYHRWSFHTGTTGDFETLVGLLTPRPVDPRVGKREMDVQFPGSGVPGVDKPELHGILKLGGALEPPPHDPPEPPDVFETWDAPFPRPLQQRLSALVNLADDFRAAGHPDPIVTPPLYGTWHALTKRLHADPAAPAARDDNWVQRLNLDPRFRAAAGFGTRVVQDQQEMLMDAAWGQIGQVIEAQRRIRLGQAGVQVSNAWWAGQLMPLLPVSPQKALLIAAPVSKRVVVSGATVHHSLEESLVQPALVSAPMRVLIRPRGRLVGSLGFDADRRPDQLVDDVASGAASAAPPKTAPPGAQTAEDLAEDLVSGVPGFVVSLLRRFRSLPLLVLLAAVVAAFVVLVLFGPIPAATVLVLGVLLWRLLVRWARAVAAADAVHPSSQTPDDIASLPGASDFVITEPGSGFTPTPGPDSPEASAFKGAMAETFGFVEAAGGAGATASPRPIDPASTAENLIEALDPSKTIPKRVWSRVRLPPHVVNEVGDGFVEPMAHPVINLPMYEPLKNRSDELFLPNIDLIEPNTITLMVPNQRFIEAYMVGLNHEFARELLWREYPTDMRGTPLRQFWDPRGYLDTDGLDDEALREKLRDIPPLHRWSLDSALGEHDNRDQPGRQEKELVLVIRGELLKRYPTAVVYAHRACWQRRGAPADDPCSGTGAIDNSKERRLVPLTPAEEVKPPKGKVRTPIYEAKVDPDIYFLGFDLTENEARGESGEDPDDDPGWFFVIKERPGESRFGLDTDKQPTLNVWNDLSWPDVQPGPDGSHIVLGTAPPTFTLVAPTGAEQEKARQFEDDRKVSWSRDMSSAELAYIFFQAPVLVGVHANEMLPKSGRRG